MSTFLLTKRNGKKILRSAPKKDELPRGQTVKSWIAKQKEAFLLGVGFGGRKPKTGWKKFQFPLHYNSNILESMYALVRLNVPYSSDLLKPIQIIIEKCNDKGQWIMDNSLNGKMRVDIEEVKKPSKWITYFALSVLNHYKKHFHQEDIRNKMVIG